MGAKISGFKMADGTIIGADVFACLVPSYNEDGTIKNFQIVSPKNINLEPTKGLKVKPGNKAQIEYLSDKTGDLREVVVKAWRSVEVDTDGKSPKLGTDGLPIDLDDEILVRLKQYCTEMEINTYDKANTTRKNGKLLFKNKDAWQKGVIEGASLDVRGYSTGAGTGGGVAMQIAGVDSNSKENKFKLESDRQSLIGAASPVHSGKGGDGMEFGTFNNEHASLFCGDYRFKADAPIYAVTRGALVTDAETGKVDYPTQADDFKDIINDTDPITWQDMINAVKYLKSQGNI